MSRISFARTRLLVRLAAPVFLAAARGACLRVPDWVDPTGWFGTDTRARSDQSGSATADATQTAGQTPDLASIPPKPTPPSTPDEQQQVAGSLVADRAQAQYSAETLQGGTEPVAAPPPETSDTTTAPSAPAAPADQSGKASPAAAAATADTAPEPAAADSSGTQVASTESAATTAPAAAPMAAATSNTPPAADMQAGFAPSHAPALDASVTLYVPQRILYRYQQTAAAAAVPGVEGMSASAAAKPAHRRKATAVQTEPATDTAAPPAQ
jgi:hypothetical protein